ncbi:DUF4212 domain-containing protein [Candidatus Poribacteria bacterium]|nr:MAG: DUF4212 domain-containing protein [Candidatus Poribacteria bacterium]
MKTSDRNRAYWRKNLQYLAILLGIWFVTSFLCSIVFVEQLDRIQIGGYRIGFYFAQQASIWIFVELIFVYAMLMNRLDKKYRATEEESEDETQQ